MGELKFEFGEKGEEDSDKIFTGSVRNLLVLIKDFYGADGTAVYWFNRAKQSFKLLAASIDGKVGEYKERFSLGNDYVSTVCLRKETDIFNIETEKEKILIGHHAVEDRVKSIIAVPLILDDEVIAVVLCESKTLNFFGTPNIYTLKVFSESISNYIKYYSLNEDFIFAEGILGSLASGIIKDDDSAYELIKTIFDRYVIYERIYIAIKEGDEFYVVKEFNKEEVVSNGLNDEIAVEHGSVAYLSVEKKRISVHDIGKDRNGFFRFFKNESLGTPQWYCCMPVIFDDECFALVSFDAASNVHINQKILSRIYKLFFPVFMFIENRHQFLDFGVRNLFLDERAFLLRLDEEIVKSRLFNDNNMYCVLFGIDNMDILKDEAGGFEEAEQLLAEFLSERLAGFRSIFKLGDNKYGLIAGVNSEDKIFLELEKLRKSLSAKIYNIKGKEISFTASFAIKRFDDLNLNMHDYIKEIEDLLELAQTEGGNVVKI